MLRRRPRPGTAVTPRLPTSDPVSALAHIYTALAGVLRDQVAAQLESASSNSLESVGLLAADVALVVALILVRASDPTRIAGYWWAPLPLAALSAGLLVVPYLSRSRNKHKFLGGPSVPGLLAVFAREPQTPEDMLVRLIKDLQSTWQNNDTLLARERRYIRGGLYALCGASVLAVALYSWRLN